MGELYTVVSVEEYNFRSGRWELGLRFYLGGCEGWDETHGELRDVKGKRRGAVILGRYEVEFPVVSLPGIDMGLYSGEYVGREDE